MIITFMIYYPDDYLWPLSKQFSNRARYNPIWNLPFFNFTQILQQAFTSCTLFSSIQLPPYASTAIIFSFERGRKNFAKCIKGNFELADDAARRLHILPAGWPKNTKIKASKASSMKKICVQKMYHFAKILSKIVVNNVNLQTLKSGCI